MHVWIIEIEFDGKYFPVVRESWHKRSSARLELRNVLKKHFPNFKYRIVKYTSTKGK